MDRSTNREGHARLGNALIDFCVFGLAASATVKILHPAKVVAYMGYLGYEHETLFLIAGLELMTGAPVARFLLSMPTTTTSGLFQQGCF